MRWARLGEAFHGGEGVDAGDGGGDEERQAVAHERGDAADRRAEREPRTERGAEQPEQPRRSSGGATSVTAACATDTLAPLAPSMMRPRNSNHSNEPASPVSKLPNAVPTSDMMITGLRPTRSDSRPVIGENTSCAIENDATSRPAVAGDAPASRA